jgi:alpha-L-rhamnosidase
VLSRWIGVLALFLPIMAQATQPVDLKCDFRTDPLAVDRPDPLLSWRLDGGRRGLAQQGYQIQVASSVARLDQPDHWDSGWVEGPQSIAIPYAGRPAAPREPLFWRVRIRDEDDHSTAWSAPAIFWGGLREERDWLGAAWISCTRELQPEMAPPEVMGAWIAPAAVPGARDTVTLHHSFDLLPKPVVHAGAWWSHTASGSVELMINGRKGLSGAEGPATIHYKDFGFELNEKGNELSLTLTAVAPGTPVSFGMRVVYADGTEQLIQSGGKWRAQVGSAAPFPVAIVGAYGHAPWGEARISPRAPVPVAWYKKDFPVTGSVASARLYICGLGYNEPYLNGQKVGDHVLSPGQADYEEFAHYEVFDAKEHLREGSNSLAVLLGDGWYNNDRMFSHARFAYGKPGLRALLEIRYADGTRTVVTTDETWHWKPSGITAASVFMGDHTDYRQWHDEWREPGTPVGWLPVTEVPPLSPRLIAQDFPPIRVIAEIDPVRTWQTGEKTWIVDLGRNLSGWIALSFDEPAGTTIRIRASEMLAPDGRSMGNVPYSFFNCHAAPQNHSIIADGRPRQWRPHFSYHGFRFAEISGLSRPPAPWQIKGLVVHTEAPVTATFRSSDPLLDRIFKMGIDTHHANMHSILEDCPTREKCLWGGDAHASWATGFQALETAAFYRQQVRLFYTPPLDPLGIPGRIGVGKRSTNKTLDFTWSVSPLFLAWRNYQVNGDLQTAADHYGMMRQFLRFFEQNAPGLIPHIHRYGDHAAPVGIPRDPADSQLIAALNFYAAADRFTDFAQALGRDDDVRWSRDLATRIRQAVVAKYYDAGRHTFGNGTHDSLALAFGLVEPAERAAVAASLAGVYKKNGQQFDGGFMSYFIYPQLAEHGHVDLALAMLRNADYPGIAQSIRDFDATTIFEQFYRDDPAAQRRQSLNHHAMNHPTAWMLNWLAGIRLDPVEPGGRRLVLAPAIPRDLQSVDATMRTAYGLVRSAWHQQEHRVRWQFTIPPNSVASVRLPARVQSVRLDATNRTWPAAGFELSAGTYLLEWETPPADPHRPRSGNSAAGWNRVGHDFFSALSPSAGPSAASY